MQINSPYMRLLHFVSLSDANLRILSKSSLESFYISGSAVSKLIDHKLHKQSSRRLSKFKLRVSATFSKFTT